MIRRIQVLNYRCLRYVDIALDRFHVLGGASGSGKSTLLDAVAFLGDLIRDGPEAAVRERAGDFRDLVWGRPAKNARFAMAAEFEIPAEYAGKLGKTSGFQRFRYEIVVADQGDGPGIESERGILMPATSDGSSPQESLFADPPPPRETIPSGSRRRGSMTVFSKSPTGNDSFNIETIGAGGKGWAVRIAFGPRRSTLANLPEAPESFPASTYIRQLLAGGVQRMALDEVALRRPSPPGRQAATLAPDGSNLPRAAGHFRATDAAGFHAWTAQLRKALPELEEVLVEERQGDRHTYLTIRETTGMEMPMQALADGTLRLIAVTLLPRLSDTGGIWLLQNEADGLDVPSLQAAYESLSSVARAQVLVETRSPMFILGAQPGERLHFARNAEGATVIFAGDARADSEKENNTEGDL